MNRTGGTDPACRIPDAAALGRQVGRIRKNRAESRLLLSEGARSAGDAIPSPTVGARSAGDAATSPPAVAGSAGDSDPFDYEASEQISEDLSVSFPVDI